MNEDKEPEEDGRRDDKVARLISKYGLSGLGDELEELWTAEGSNRKSLRELADHFNKQLLATELRSAGEHPLGGEVENFYQLLTTGEATADRTRAKRQLERTGIDIEELLADFVSYQTIRRYLTETRDAEYSQTEASRIETTATHLQRLKSRAVSVTESKVASLNESGEVAVGEAFRTTAEIYVTCPDCESRFEIQELLDNRGCGCSADDQ